MGERGGATGHGETEHDVNETRDRRERWDPRIRAHDYTDQSGTKIVSYPFPSYDKSAADDFEHILSKNGKSL